MKKKRIICIGKNSKLYRVLRPFLPNHYQITHKEIDEFKFRKSDITINFFKSKSIENDKAILEKIKITNIIYFDSIASEYSEIDSIEFKYCKYKKALVEFIKTTNNYSIIQVGTVLELIDNSLLPSGYIAISSILNLIKLIKESINDFNKSLNQIKSYKIGFEIKSFRGSYNLNKCQKFYLFLLLNNNKSISLLISIYIRLFLKKVSGYSLLSISLTFNKIQIGRGAFGKAYLENKKSNIDCTVYSPFENQKFNYLNKFMYQWIGLGKDGLDRIRHRVEMQKTNNKKNIYKKTRKIFRRRFFKFNNKYLSQYPLHVLNIQDRNKIWKLYSINKNNKSLPLFCNSLNLAAGSICNSSFILDLDPNLKKIKLSDHEILLCGVFNIKNINNKFLLSKNYLGFLKYQYSVSLYSTKYKIPFLFDFRPFSPLRFKDKNFNLINAFLKRLNEYFYNITGIAISSRIMIHAQILHPNCVTIYSGSFNYEDQKILNKKINHSYNAEITQDVIDTLNDYLDINISCKSSLPSHHIYGFDKNVLNSKVINNLVKNKRLKVIGAPLGKDLQEIHHTEAEIRRIKNLK